MALFNKVIKGGYGDRSYEAAIKLLLDTMKKIRGGDLFMTMERFYILKADGKRYRPIGAPLLNSRIIAKAVNDMLYFITLGIRLPKVQHGYMKNRGTWSAIIEVRNKLLDGYRGYEFDLKSFFNTVAPSLIFKRVGEASPLLAYFTSDILGAISYKWTHLKEEAELVIKGRVKYKGGYRLVIKRNGVPQGLAFSPLVATLALEDKLTPENLVMYADDGIYFYKDNKNRFIKWMDSLFFFGVKVAPEKCSNLGSNFKFLGCEFDLVKMTVAYRGSVMGLDSEDREFETGAKTVTNTYGEVPVNGNGDVKKEALIKTLKLNLWGYERVIIIFKGIMYQKAHKGYRYLGGIGIVDVVSSSSICMNKLARKLGVEGKLVNRLRISPILYYKTAFKPRKVINDYVEEIQYIGPPHYKPGEGNS